MLMTMLTMMMLMVVVVVIILLVHVRVWQDGGTRRPNGELIYKPLERENQHFHHLLNFFLVHSKIVLQATGDSPGKERERATASSFKLIHYKPLENLFTGLQTTTFPLLVHEKKLPRIGNS